MEKQAPTLAAAGKRAAHAVRIKARKVSKHVIARACLAGRVCSATFTFTKYFLCRERPHAVVMPDALSHTGSGPRRGAEFRRCAGRPRARAVGFPRFFCDAGDWDDSLLATLLTARPAHSQEVPGEASAALCRRRGGVRHHHRGWREGKDKVFPPTTCICAA